MYADAEHQKPIGDQVVTDASGKATVNLVSGTYYFNATKADFINYQGEFIVNHDVLTVEFTMQGVEHTVTFTETNTLEGVTIQVYADAEHREPIGGQVVTDGTGKAVIKLVNGTYYFVASKESYQNKEGNFVVNGDNVQVAFAMEVET